MTLSRMAIINTSPSDISTTAFLIKPGQRIRLSDYYRSEADARADLDLAKHVARGAIIIREIDWEGIANVQVAIAEAERKEAESRARERQIAADRRRERQEARQRGIIVSRAQNQMEREAREAQASTHYIESMAHLFEKSRKERIARAIAKKLPQERIDRQVDKINSAFDAAEAALRREEQAMRAEPMAPIVQEPEIIPASPATIHESLGGAPEATDLSESLSEELLIPASRVSEDLVSTVPARDEDVISTVPVSTEEEVELEESEESNVDLDSLTSRKLRYLVEKFMIPNRGRLKSKADMISAIRALALSDDDLRDALAESEE